MLMKINLIENAVDSLQIAMRAFSLWNEDCESRYSFRYLKVTIEFLHNAMELLLKAILNEDDEKAIYCMENEKQKFCIENARKKAKEEHISLIECAIKMDEIKTLSYNELLSKLIENGKIYRGREKECLEKLGIYRNRVMHLGIDATDDLCDLLAVIHENFKIIIEDNFYEELWNLSDYFSYSDVLDTLEPWRDESGAALRSFSTTIEKRKLAVFDKMIENIINSNKLANFLDHYNIDLEDYSDYEDDYINLKFQCKEKKVELTTIYDAFYNYTIIVMIRDYYKMIFCVMHFENEICIGNKWFEYDNAILESIHNRETKDEFFIKPLTENNIRNCLVDVLKKTILSDV